MFSYVLECSRPREAASYRPSSSSHDLVRSRERAALDVDDATRRHRGRLRLVVGPRRLPMMRLPWRELGRRRRRRRDLLDRPAATIALAASRSHAVGSRHRRGRRRRRVATVGSDGEGSCRDYLPKRGGAVARLAPLASYGGQPVLAIHPQGRRADGGGRRGRPADTAEPTRAAHAARGGVVRWRHRLSSRLDPAAHAATAASGLARGGGRAGSGGFGGGDSRGVLRAAAGGAAPPEEGATAGVDATRGAWRERSNHGLAADAAAPAAQQATRRRRRRRRGRRRMRARGSATTTASAPKQAAAAARGVVGGLRAACGGAGAAAPIGRTVTGEAAPQRRCE